MEKDISENGSDLKSRFEKFLHRDIARSVNDGKIVIEPNEIPSFIKMSPKEHLDLYFSRKNQKLNTLLADDSYIMECCSYSDDLKYAKRLFEEEDIHKRIINLRIIQNLFCSSNKEVTLGENMLKELIDFVRIYDHKQLFANVNKTVKLQKLFSWDTGNFMGYCGAPSFGY